MSSARQTWIGLFLTALIMGAWLVLHVYGVFFADLSRPLLSLGLILLLTWLSVGMYIVAHDAMHGSLWPANRAAGDRIGALAVGLYAGFSFRQLCPKHHAHHRNPGSVDDPDFAPDTPGQAIAWYGRFLKTYFRQRELLIMAIRVGVYLLLGARVENILLFFAVPGILSSFQLFYFGTYLPHRHTHAQSKPLFPDHHNSRSNQFGYLSSLLTCFHFGYHHEHHLQPGVPWWRLPSIRKAPSP
ncbi:MAG TPA: fatty acid desaturase [Noviherbaspirillum sp.]|jgi:beta-carotene ketolase (CrtW type)|uniref:fatty acid desaturase n=1 Tax=Noviherbaspirillum sp. TaxID=1926288 RepID=UPI002DDD1436|nr:fatty acid desaturase [Noviherbaspirillum sp.]HEV2612916.1 fatty acid desaturase [Noviherbaspirillum sp.]